MGTWQGRGKKIGVIIGGSGLIGGSLMHYFKKHLAEEVDIYAPNSKKLSIREPDDIHHYFLKIRPDFIINSAIASIDSDPQLAFEVNYLGCINLARKAIELNIPYIHISSAATLPPGEELTEEDHLPLTPELSNYAKSKLMAEISLAHLGRSEGLDYTAIRLGVVYGKHDHKIQGFHRLLFSIAAKAMPVMFTRQGVLHSYSNSEKLPFFVHHVLVHREGFAGHIYNFVDRNPVELSQLILTVKSYLELNSPKEIYVPYLMAQGGKMVVQSVIKGLARLGVEARMPAELMFLKNFYQTQTLSRQKLDQSTFADPFPERSVFTELPGIIQYYITRWEQLNLIGRYNKDFFDPRIRVEEFLRSPQELVESLHSGTMDSPGTSGDQGRKK